MEPAFYRGDLLFLTNPPEQRYNTGDITVYKIPGADIPIVHRVMETHDVVPKKSKSAKCFMFLVPRSLHDFVEQEENGGRRAESRRSTRTNQRRQQPRGRHRPVSRPKVSREEACSWEG